MVVVDRLSRLTWVVVPVVHLAQEEQELAVKPRGVVAVAVRFAGTAVIETRGTDDDRPKSPSPTACQGSSLW